MVIWHDQGSKTVRQRLKDADEARGIIKEVEMIQVVEHRSIMLTKYD